MAVTYKEYSLLAGSGVIEYKNFSKYNTLYVDVKTLGNIESISEHGSDYIINFANTDVILKNGKKNFKYIKTSEESVPLQISSPDFPIQIYITAPQKGQTVKGTANDDKILLSSYPVSADKGLVINAGKGDDYIEGTSGSDKITGGAGTNTIFYNDIKFGTDTVILTKNETLNIEFDNKIVWEDFSYAPVNKNRDLEITSNSFDDSKIIISNYLSKNIASSVSVNGINPAETHVLEHVTAENFFEQPNKKPVYTYLGTAVADYVDAGGISEGNKPVTIKTGYGNDTIIASERTDNITAGAGHNTIVYNNKRSLDGDKIYLTKGENLDIDVSDIMANDNFLDIYYNVNGKNLDITFKNSKTGTKTSFTIVNFGTKDSSNNATKKSEDTSKVRLITGAEPVDLKEVLLSELNIYKNYTGTWHADNINAKDAKKGLRINGGAGYDKIIGSDYSDTITGGTGDDVINAGKGNNSIIFTQGCGNDIIQNGGGADTLCLNGIKYNSIFAYSLENDNNLYIEFGVKGDCITVENFAEDYLNGTNSVQKIKVGNKTYSIDNFLPESYFENINSCTSAWLSLSDNGFNISDIQSEVDTSQNLSVYSGQSLEI